ncbi:MAG: hypothetical protein LBB62_03580 [Proteiniphilum sp.]|jgi:hypothetical protein|nr:hypothetical protein [Proteiniphilum sp.]
MRSNIKGYGCLVVGVPIRGGNWNNGANAGVASLNLNNARSNVNNNIGCRAALPLSQERILMGRRVYRGEKESYPFFVGPKKQTGRENMYRSRRQVGIHRIAVILPEAAFSAFLE